MQREKGYTWLFFYMRPAWICGLAVTLLSVSVSYGFYLWYSRYGSDPEAAGNVGLSYALVGLAFALLAGTLYSLRRRGAHTRGLLNSALNWHVFFACIALALLLMHSFGDFEASSGTYALASLVALSLSGILGRLLDRVLAWRIAIAVDSTLTSRGEDRSLALTRQSFDERDEIECAYRRELRYRTIIYLWRQIHIALAVGALVLIIWHIVTETPVLLSHLFAR